MNNIACLQIVCGAFCLRASGVVAAHAIMDAGVVQVRM